MKPFSVLLIKVLALYLGVRAIYSATPFMFSPGLEEVWSSEWMPVIVAIFLLPIVGGLVLWFCAGAIANRIHGDTEPALSIKDHDLVRAGLFLIGVFLLVQHIGILVNRYTSSGDVAYGSVVVVFLGLLMVLGTGVLADWYSRLKYFGSNT